MSIGWFGWQPETDNDNPDDREGVYYLTIVDGPGADNEEVATIMHRVCDGRFPLDGELAERQLNNAQVIVAALNSPHPDGGTYADRLWDGEWIDRSNPSWPRNVHDAHLAADKDHTPTPESAYGDELSDNCSICGLATTSDGKRHGSDAS